ncbi:MAG TPA: hypothetical protein EYQ81_03390 [Sneathiellales bacterium]|jgi:hypothetical protein|nr:hypothetical protein [Sneathiellales bacterium]
MPDWLDRVKGWIKSITGVGLALIPVGLVLQILFDAPVRFVTGDILDNLMGLISQLGDAGLVGLIALGIILWLFRGQN